MKVFAHRGFTKHHPGNSLPAIDRALDEGYGVEVDMRSTKDGYLILCHDRFIPAVNGGCLDVSQTNLTDLYDFAATGRYGADAYPRVENVLSLFARKHAPDAELAIHLKDDTDDIGIVLCDLTMKVENEINESDLLESTFVFDASINTARRIAYAAPQLRVGLSVGEAAIASDSRHPTVYSYDEIRSVGFDVVWADEWLGSLYTEGFVAQCHADDRSIMCVSPELHRDTTPMHPAASNYASRWPTIVTIGVDGICTDHPDEFRDLLAS